jgi:uncharacterized membrane protein YhaH (DUF805 family)
VGTPYSSYGEQGGYGQQDPQQGYPQQLYPPPGYGQQAGYGARRTYLQGGPVGLGEAIRNQLQNVFNFQGRASLSAYWWYTLATVITGWVLEAVGGLVAAGTHSPAPFVAFFFVAALVGLAGLSLFIRRLHDSDKSGWMWLLLFIPFVGAIVVLVMLCTPGAPGPNRFG